MRDYFAFIIKPGVTGVTTCNVTQKVSPIKDYSKNDTITPLDQAACNTGNTPPQDYVKALHPVTPDNEAGVTLKASNTAVLHPLHLVTPDNTEAAYEFEERAAIIEYDANLPRNWAEAFARMDCSPKPPQLTPSCWQRIKNATGVLLDKHIHALIAHGWQVADIFGCHAVAPERNYSVMGLVFLMAKMEVTHIDADSITLVTPGGAVQKYRKSPQDYPKVMVWELQTGKE